MGDEGNGGLLTSSVIASVVRLTQYEARLLQ